MAESGARRAGDGPGDGRTTSGRRTIPREGRSFGSRVAVRVFAIMFVSLGFLGAVSLLREYRFERQEDDAIARLRASAAAGRLATALASPAEGRSRLPDEAVAREALARELLRSVPGGSTADLPLVVAGADGRMLNELPASPDALADEPGLVALREALRASGDGGPLTVSGDRIRWSGTLFRGGPLDGFIVAAGVRDARAERRLVKEVLWRAAVAFLALLLAAAALKPLLAGTSRDLTALLDFARSSGAGDASVAPPRIERTDEIGVLGDALVRSLEGLRSSRRELEHVTKALEERVEVRTGALNRANEELRKRAEELAAASRGKDEFLATVSHELRTPLNSIIGLTQIVRDGEADSPEEVNAFLDQVLGSSRHLLLLINQILDLSKLEAGKMDLQLEPVPTAQIIAEARGIVGPLAAKKGLSLEVEIAPDAPIVLADNLRLKQVLVNLLDNAVKFTEKGRVVVRVLPSDGRRKALFEVEDTGVGIPPERRRAVFEKFIQAEAGTTRRFGGTGLGLPISRLLVEAMDGVIGIDGGAGGAGTRVWFTLPAPGMEGR